MTKDSAFIPSGSVLFSLFDTRVKVGTADVCETNEVEVLVVSALPLPSALLSPCLEFAFLDKLILEALFLTRVESCDGSLDLS